MIGLVNCTKQQKDEKTRAKELFMESPLFKKARRYCEETYGTWFILSAKYGLLHPDQEVEPYKERLSDAGKEQREKWSEAVYNQLKEKGLVKKTLVFHTGKAYYEHLLPLLEEHDASYLLPVKGLGYGKRMGWYNDRIPDNE